MWGEPLTPTLRKFQYIISGYNSVLLTIVAILYIWSLACMLSCSSHVWVCDPVDRSPVDSAVRGILQGRTLEWVAVPSSRWSSWPRDWTWVPYISCIGRRVLYHWHHLGCPRDTVYPISKLRSNRNKYWWIALPESSQISTQKRCNKTKSIKNNKKIKNKKQSQ